MEASLRDGELLQEMIDHFAIRKVLATYAHGSDRGDGARMASVYAETSWDDHGAYKGPGQPFAKRTMDALAARGSKCTHLLGQSQIKVAGDEAGVETYFLTGIAIKDGEGKDALTLLSGRFVDSFVREKGEWRVRHRICVRDWSITLDASRDGLRNKEFVLGLLSGEDPSYPALGLEHSGLPWAG
jgi:hypothetical protein